MLEAVTASSATGWVFDENATEPLTVELRSQGGVHGRAKADIYRPDLLAAGYGNGRCGFEIEIAEQDGLAPDWGSGLFATCLENGITLSNHTHDQTRRLSNRFLNSTINGMPHVDAGRTEGVSRRKAISIVSELEGVAERLEKDDLPDKSLWTSHSESHDRIITCVKERRWDELADICRRLPMLDAGAGFMQGAAAHRALNEATQDARSAHMVGVKDALVSLAQMMGLERLECAEQGAFGQVLHVDTDRLVERLDRHLKVPVVPPDIFEGLYGLQCRSGILTDRDVQALYAAHRLVRGHFSGLREEQRNVCEIGAGAGRAAYYSRRLGARSVTLVDLTPMLVIQYFTLRASLPRSSVAFVTDPDQEMGEFNLVPASMFARLSPRWRFDAVLNCDSFPEMGEEVCNDYLTALAGRTPILLSINQEAMGPLNLDGAGARQVPVSHVMAKRDDYVRHYRFRTWIRQGYAEEVFSPRT